MKMKLYYVVERISDDTCEMLHGPMCYNDAYEKAAEWGEPKYFFVVHRWVEVGD